jgi:hypothetical protein
MKRKTLLQAAAAAGTALLLMGSSCSNDSILQAPLVMDTALVLELAKATSETAEPFAVNNGLFVFSDTSEVTDPVPVN